MSGVRRRPNGGNYGSSESRSHSDQRRAAVYRDARKEAAKTAAGGVGKSTWEWVRAKLTSEAGREVVKDLESAPADADNRKAAEAALSKLLRSDPNAFADLARLLEQAGVTSVALTANVAGDET